MAFIQILFRRITTTHTAPDNKHCYCIHYPYYPYNDDITNYTPPPTLMRSGSVFVFLLFLLLLSGSGLLLS